MDVVKHARTPVPGRGHGDFQPGDGGLLPRFKGAHLGEAQVENQVLDAARDYENGTPVAPGDGAQGRPVQVVHVRVGKQDQVDGRQIAQAYARFTAPFEDDEIAREDRIDQHAPAAKLE